MVQPPGIDKGGFQLRIDNVWFCKVLFLFSFVSQNHLARKQHTVHLSLFLRNIREEGAQVSYICIFSIYMHILHIMHIFFSGWIDRVNSAMIYERKSNKQVLYVLLSSAYQVHLVQYAFICNKICRDMQFICRYK